MKLNWGTGIILAFAAFIAFILYFVVLASTDQRANHDLVTDNYYEDELGYQQDIDAMANARDANFRIIVSKNNGGIAILFPESLDGEDIKGTIALYRPSNKKLDFELPILLVDSQMSVPAARLPEGRWNLTVRWKLKDKDYLIKESFTYNQVTPETKVK